MSGFLKCEDYCLVTWHEPEESIGDENLVSSGIVPIRNCLRSKEYKKSKGFGFGSCGAFLCIRSCVIVRVEMCTEVQPPSPRYMVDQPAPIVFIREPFEHRELREQYFAS